MTVGDKHNGMAATLGTVSAMHGKEIFMKTLNALGPYRNTPAWEYFQAEGKAEGLAEGEARGLREVIFELGAQALGQAPRWAQTRVGDLSLDELHATVRRLPKAKSWEDLLHA